MNYKYPLILFFSICLGSVQAQTEVSEHLISVKDFLIIQAKDSNYTLVDFRKNEAYLNGHIEHAQQLWRTSIVDSTLAFDGMKISRIEMKVLLGNLGVKSNHKIIIYDTKGNPDAARLW